MTDSERAEGVERLTIWRERFREDGPLGWCVQLGDGDALATEHEDVAVGELLQGVVDLGGEHEHAVAGESIPTSAIEGVIEQQAQVLDHIASEASHGRPRVAEDYETLANNLLAVASRLRRLLPEEVA